MLATRQMIRELIDAKIQDLPEVAVKKIKWAVLDDVGIAFQGYAMAGRVFAEYARDAGGSLEATVVGDGAKVSAGVAAGVNANMAYLSNFNETGPGGHALSIITQPAIAMGERLGSSGNEILAAVVAVYEINARLHHAATDHDNIAHDYMGGNMGTRHLILNTALVCGKLMNLDETQMNHLVGLAWTLPPPQRGFVAHAAAPSVYRSMGSSANVMICPVGVQAALLAQKGFEGTLDVLEKVGVYDLEILSKSPSPYYYTLNELYLKSWPVNGGGSHHAIDLATSIVKEEGIQPQDIDEIRFFVKEAIWFEHPFNFTEPKDYLDAIYSVPRAMATAILGYEPGPAWFTEESFKDPRVPELARKVKILKDPQVTELGQKHTPIPKADGRHVVEVSVKGRTYRKETAYIDVIGGPRRPLSNEFLEAKFRRLVTPVIGKADTEELLSNLSRLEDVRDIRDLTKHYKHR